MFTFTEMSTENHLKCTEKKQGLSPSAQENNVGEQGKSVNLHGDGNKEITG
jgi:hypothetical protein